MSDIGAGRSALSSPHRTKGDFSWQLVVKCDEIPTLHFGFPISSFEHFQMQHHLAPIWVSRKLYGSFEAIAT
jgi:hypothetical protein